MKISEETYLNRSGYPLDSRRLLPAHAMRLRGFDTQQGADEQAALAMGMEQKAMEFVKQGAEVYHKA